MRVKTSGRALLALCGLILIVATVQAATAPRAHLHFSDRMLYIIVADR